MPSHTIENMFKFIADNQEIFKTDFITWTGDNAAHNNWSKTREEASEATLSITKIMKDTLKNHSSIKVFPAIGNHDFYPDNIYDFADGG